MSFFSGLGWTEIFVAIISVSGVIASSTFAFLATKRSSDISVEQKLQRASFSFSEYLGEINSLDADVRTLFDETHIDRFLILRAWNGSMEPKWTSAVYQMRKIGQQYTQYSHFELDDDYKGRLRELLTRGTICFSVEEIDDSRIKSVYRLEGVRHSAWYLVDQRNLSEVGAKAITYCSFATHDEKKLSGEELTRCQLIVDKLRASSIAFHSGESA